LSIHAPGAFNTLLLSAFLVFATRIRVCARVRSREYRRFMCERVGYFQASESPPPRWRRRRRRRINVCTRITFTVASATRAPYIRCVV
jgi:hypothetical protein